MNQDSRTEYDVADALRASEARLRKAQAVARMGDWELDRKTGAMNWSRGLFKLFERPFEFGTPDLNEALGYYAPESIELTRDTFWRVIDSGQGEDLEQTVWLPSGAERRHATTIVPVKDAEGYVFKLYGTTQDITARKLVEEELRRQTREIEDLYENAPCGYYSLDAKGAIVRINNTQLHWLGYSREEVVGRMKIVDLFSPASRALFEQVFRVFKRNGILRNMEFDLLRKDGSLLPVLLSAAALFDGNGTFIASRTVVSDNSDRKQLELERIAHAARVTELSRHMVEVQEHERRQLASELHDRASPNLAALQLTLTNLARALPKAERIQLQPFLDDACGLLMDTTNGIREICTNLRPAALDYAGLVPALLEYAQQFGQRTGIEVTVDSTNFSVKMAANVQSLLFRIAQEALTNCAKHAHATAILIRLTNCDTEVKMQISDDGVGFDPKRIDGRGATPGIGLITMRERAEFAGGTFSLQSQPGSGTEIMVIFEHEAGVLRQRSPQSQSAASAGQSLRTGGNES